MSRPGFPVSMSQTLTLHNNYHSGTGSDFPGTDLLLSRTVFADKVGDNTPGWPEVKRDNAYMRYGSHWNQSPLTVNGHVAGSTDTFDGQWGNTFGLGYNPSNDLNFSQSDAGQDVYNRLIMKMIGQIQANRVEIGEIIHTRDAAANMAVDAMTRIGEAFRALRRGNPKAAAAALGGKRRNGQQGRRGSSNILGYAGGIPDQWLALQYGWMPLVKDVYAAIQNCDEAQQVGKEFRARADAKSTQPALSIKDRAADHGPELEVSVTDRSVKGHAEIVYELDNSVARASSQFGITNPLSLAWELLPYSFIVDWFVPIGPYLSAMDYTRGLVFKRGFTSITYRQKFKRRISSSTGISPLYLTSWSGGSGNGEAFLFQRSPLNGFPSVPIPQLKSPFSLTHFANALSLMASAVSGGADTHRR